MHRTSRVSKVSAPGKIILSGEHAVVYGYPAVVAAVNRRLRINEKFEVESDIPIGCGMGSSAAYAVALTAMKMKLAGQEFDKFRINKKAYIMEKDQHGNPSGVDNTVSTYGGFLWYRKEVESFKISSPIQFKRKLPDLFLLNTGKPDESTKEMVSYVGDLCRRKKRTVNQLLRKFEEVTRSFLKYLLTKEDLSFKDLIHENEHLLEELGVVSSTTKDFIRQIERLGGAAKISGAGGRKSNSGVLIIYHDQPAKILDFARKKNLEIFKVKLGEEGVRSEEKN